MCPSPSRQNIVVAGDGRIKVLDFGLAKDVCTAVPTERAARTAARRALPCASTCPVTSAYPLRAAFGHMEGRRNRMNAIATVFILSVSISVGTGISQNEPGAPVNEPQYAGSFYALDANGQLRDLEHTTVTFHAKAKVLPGHASVNMITQFKPARSPVRLGAATQFIVRGRGSSDPLSRFELRVLKSSSAHREFVVTTAHDSDFDDSAVSDLEEGEVAIRFEEYGSDSYRITSVQPLPPGEYALARRGLVSVKAGVQLGRSELYCFGVDQ
jgi:hypothetical protein